MKRLIALVLIVLFALTTTVSANASTGADARGLSQREVDMMLSCLFFETATVEYAWGIDERPTVEYEFWDHGKKTTERLELFPDKSSPYDRKNEQESGKVFFGLIDPFSDINEPSVRSVYLMETWLSGNGTTGSRSTKEYEIDFSDIRTVAGSHNDYNPEELQGPGRYKVLECVYLEDLVPVADTSDHLEEAAYAVSVYIVKSGESENTAKKDEEEKSEEDSAVENEAAAQEAQSGFVQPGTDGSLLSIFGANPPQGPFWYDKYAME